MALTEEVCLEGHSERVWCAAWSPCGRRIASCGGDKAIRVWGQKDDGYVLQDMLDGQHNRTIRAVAWSRSGKTIASASFDASVSIFAEEENDGKTEFECTTTLEGHDNEVKCVAWSADDQLLATCSRDKSVWIWALEEDEEFVCVAVLHGHTQDVKYVAWHPTEQLLVSCSYDDTVRLWRDAGSDDDWACAHTLEGHTSTVWSCAFDPSGHRLATCSDDKSIIIWQRQTSGGLLSFVSGGKEEWRRAATLSGHHTWAIFSVAWSPAGVLASAGGDGSICVYTEGAAADDGSPTFALAARKLDAHATDVNSVAWNPRDGALLLSAGDDTKLRVWRFQA